MSASLTPASLMRPRLPLPATELLECGSGDGFGHRLLLEVLLEAGHTHLAAEPRLLVAAERHVGAVPEAAVHRHRPRADAPGDAQHPLAIGAGHAARQPVDGV